MLQRYPIFRATITALLVLLSTVANAAESGDVLVTVEGLKSNEGEIRYGFFESVDTFAKGDKAMRKGATPIHDLKARFVIKAVPYGEYAIIIAQDKDMNGKIAKIINAEPRGVSNYTEPLKWFPNFDKAKFGVYESEVSIRIRIF